MKTGLNKSLILTILISITLFSGCAATDPLGKAIAQNNGDLKKALVQITKGHTQPAKFDPSGNLISLNLCDDKAAGLKINDASLAHLKGPDVQSLVGLNIGGANELTEKSLPYLVQLKGLKSLYMGSRLSDKGLKYLADNLHDLTGNLQLVASRKNGLNANSLNHLRQGAFKNINKLSLYGFNLSGKGSLDFISDLSGLSAIFIYGKLNDANIENIAKRCTDLKILQLDLKGNQIGLTDLALTHLKSMKSLEKLEFFDANPFSNTAIEEFRKTLPDCEVIAR